MGAKPVRLPEQQQTQRENVGGYHNPVMFTHAQYGRHNEINTQSADNSASIVPTIGNLVIITQRVLEVITGRSDCRRDAKQRFIAATF